MEKRVLEKLAYYSLLVIGIIFIVTSILTQLKLDIDFIDKLILFVREIATLFMVVVVAFSGWNFAKSRLFVWKVIYLIVAVLAVLGSLMTIIA